MRQECLRFGMQQLVCGQVRVVPQQGMYRGGVATPQHNVLSHLAEHDTSKRCQTPPQYVPLDVSLGLPRSAVTTCCQATCCCIWSITDFLETLPTPSSRVRGMRAEYLYHNLPCC